MNGGKRSRMVRRQNLERQAMAARVVSVLKLAQAPMSAHEITCALDRQAGPNVWWKVCGALEALQSTKGEPVRQAVRRQDGRQVYVLRDLDEKLHAEGRIVERWVRLAPLRDLGDEHLIQNRL